MYKYNPQIVRTHFKQSLLHCSDNTIILGSDRLIYKFYLSQNNSNLIKDEGNILKKANQINSLSVKFISFDEVNFPLIDKNITVDCLVMERIRPFDKRAFTYADHDYFFEKLIKQVNELHRSGIVHRDIGRAISSVSEGLINTDRTYFLRDDNNILIGPNGYRLIDFGKSFFNSEAVNNEVFEALCKLEILEIENLAKHFIANF